MFALLLSLAAAFGLSLLSASTATAIGGESLGCQVNSGGTTANSCSASQPAGSYTVTYTVLNGSGSYSYAWSVAGPQVGGCTSTSNYCIVSRPRIMSDANYYGSVQITQAGQSANLGASAFIPATCSLGGVWVWC
jgi:hypothetical protein